MWGSQLTDIVALGPRILNGTIHARPTNKYDVAKPDSVAILLIFLSLSSKVTLPLSFLKIKGENPPRPAMPP
jgi:hypothetical protein